MRLLIAAALAMIGTAAQAQMPEQRVADILATLQAKTDPVAVFAPPFVAAVPPAQLAVLVAQLERENGRLLGTEDFRSESPTRGQFNLRFERATAVAIFSIEAAAPYRVTGLRIGAVSPLGDSAARIAADFAALPGRSGFVVQRLGQTAPIAASNADAQFAVGSTFKLWVLDALVEEIAAGRHRWDEVVRLNARSLPSGITQDWPPDAPVTVETLTTLMISMSDNTATDTLIRLIGRERVAARVRASGHADPSRMLPLLTTAEAFALKFSPASREAYARADDAGQARILASLDTDRLLATADLTALDGLPTAIDSIEWFASPEDVARVLDGLRRRRDPRVLQILGVAPTMAKDLRERFAYVGYKGGSEAGVVSLSWLVQRKSGDWIVVAASWNDPAAAVDTQRLAGLAERLLRLAASAD
ncbi:class A beta-lactamase-related serine hydrolase [Novosphingobium sp. JCM 18896]|uniref:class A beta-lactamase-related serine hydrolase n=1 Tax=Novosphingobium sp. JCM 18896 TaxID=2989731 RepID=UPI002221DEBA|nr:class A beta-lactamase-related serine hydrolase [Novosphingobium sp. JCM 18896]MCW1428422.1 class A beta-lactamase-related serine hydrolase [Novosphingobium sp. JCM 18896]